MKIVYLVPYYFHVFRDINLMTGGIETMICNQMKILRDKGHDIHLIHCGDVDDRYEGFTFHQIDTRVRDEITSDQKVWARSLTNMYISAVHKIKPDLVLSHIHGLSAPKKLSKDYRLLHQIHTIFGSPMLLKNHIPSYHEIIKNGGAIVTTPKAEEATRDFAIKFGLKPEKFVTHHTLSYNVFEEVFYTIFINDQPENDFFMAGRNNPDKKFENFNDFDVTIFISGEESPKITNITFYNEPREKLITELSNSKFTITGNPKEAAGLVAMEGMLLGVPPVYFVQNTGDSHALDWFTDSICPEYRLKLSWDDKDWKKKLKEHLSISVDRHKVSDIARNVFSKESWYKEFSEIEKSIDDNKKVKLSLI